MAGKRRGEPDRPAGLPTWFWGLAAVAAVLLFAWFTVPMLVGGEVGEPTKSPTDVAPRTPTTSSSPTQPTTPTDSPAPTATPKDLPALAPDQPRQLIIDGALDVGFTNAVGRTGDTLHPAADDEVSRWAERGSPGSPGEDAVVIIGTADPTDPSSAFAQLSAAAKVGTEIKVRTDLGTLTYTISKNLDVKADELLDNAELTDETPGRLVLVAEKYAPSGDRLSADLVVVAVLTKVEPA